MNNLNGNINWGNVINDVATAAGSYMNQSSSSGGFSAPQYIYLPQQQQAPVIPQQSGMNMTTALIIGGSVLALGVIVMSMNRKPSPRLSGIEVTNDETNQTN